MKKNVKNPYSWLINYIRIELGIVSVIGTAAIIAIATVLIAIIVSVSKM